MQKPTIKVITFDLDDTLWAVEPVLLRAEQQLYDWLQKHAPALTQHFTPQSWSEWRHAYYQQRPDLAHQISALRIAALQQALKTVGYPPVESSHLAQQAFEVFLKARHQVSIFTEVVPMLEKLADQFQVGALTNGNADVFKLPIGHFFDFAFSAEQLNASKPAADHFIATQRHCRCEANEIIHVGDHPQHDILAAHQAGCFSIWFNPEGDRLSADITASAQVQSLSAIPEAISCIEQAIVRADE